MPGICDIRRNVRPGMSQTYMSGVPVATSR